MKARVVGISMIVLLFLGLFIWGVYRVELWKAVAAYAGIAVGVYYLFIAVSLIFKGRD